MVNITTRRQFLGITGATGLAALLARCRFDRSGLPAPDAGVDAGDGSIDSGLDLVVENDDVIAEINQDVLYTGSIQGNYTTAKFLAYEADGLTIKEEIPAEQVGNSVIGTLQGGYSGPGIYISRLIADEGLPSEAGKNALAKVLPQYVDDIAENWGAFVGLSQDTHQERTDPETFEAIVENASSYTSFVSQETRDKVADYFDNLAGKDITDMRIIVGPGNNGFLAMEVGNANYAGMSNVYEALDIGNTDAQNMINILTTPQ